LRRQRIQHHFHPEEWQAIVHNGPGLARRAIPSLGTFVWTLFDLLGQARRGDTPGRNDKGLVPATGRCGRMRSIFTGTGPSSPWSTLLARMTTRHLRPLRSKSTPTVRTLKLCRQRGVARCCPSDASRFAAAAVALIVAKRIRGGGTARREGSPRPVRLGA